MLFVSFLSIDNIINEISRKVNRRNILSADYSAIRFIFWWKRSLNSNIPQSEINTIIQRKNTSPAGSCAFSALQPFRTTKTAFWLWNWTDYYHREFFGRIYVTLYFYTTDRKRRRRGSPALPCPFRTRSTRRGGKYLSRLRYAYTRGFSTSNTL